MALFWTTGLPRAMGGKTRLETDAKEKNASQQKFSILLQKFKEREGGTGFKTFSSSRSVGMLEGMLDRMMRILREPAMKYQKKKGQTYHGLRLI